MRYMLRQLLLILGAVTFVEIGPVQAQQISPQNPFRSYNISGVNYGSQQWEKTHNSKSSSSQQGGRVIVRRKHQRR